MKVFIYISKITRFIMLIICIGYIIYSIVDFENFSKYRILAGIISIFYIYLYKKTLKR